MSTATATMLEELEAKPSYSDDIKFKDELLYRGNKLSSVGGGEDVPG